MNVANKGEYMNNLNKLRERYNGLLTKFYKQEKWCESNPKLAEVETHGIIPLRELEKTLGELGTLGYELETTYGIKLDVKTKLKGFQLETIKQMEL